jgi:hypothetical protein
MRFLLRHIRIGNWSVPLPVLLWFVLALLAAIAEVSRGASAINNYYIFKGVFEHTLAQTNLYQAYPAEYIDTNHYGPVFSILISPFALLPVVPGCIIWCLLNAWVLFYAVRRLPISFTQQNLLLLIGLIEMMTAIHNVQFNPMLTGWILLSFVLVEEEKDIWATLWIAAGFLIKIYGIAGIAFFWFSRHKLKFAASFLFWLAVLFCLPALLSSFDFVVQSYKDWFHSLVEKNAQNVDAGDDNLMQDISVMGMIRRIFGVAHLRNYLITVPAAIGYALPFLRISQYHSQLFRISYCCFAMIGVVIFSSSAESSTFVIAVTGIALWYLIQENQTSRLHISLLIFVLLFTSLSATDLVPEYVRDHWIRPYSLKALPCFVIWCILLWQLLFTDFRKRTLQTVQPK